MLPYIKNIPYQSSLVLDRFRGINVSSDYEMGELCSSLNTDSSHYPAIGSRKKRTELCEYEGTINGIGSYDGVCYSYYNREGTQIYFVYSGISYEFTSYTESEDFSAKRYFAHAGGEILIMPDKIVFDTATRTFRKVAMSQTADYKSANRKYKLETPGLTGGYDATSTTIIGWVRHNKIETRMIEFNSLTGVSWDFYTIDFSDKIRPGDMLFIKLEGVLDGFQENQEYLNCRSRWLNGMWVKVKDVVWTTHKLYSGEKLTEITELLFEDNSLDVAGANYIDFTNISIERYIPDLDKIISYNNRIWAIRGDKIYTSRLGDAGEWNDYTVDSYGTLPSSCFSSSAGTPGDFTDIYQHGNYIYAFKENYIHKIYGDTPDEYSFSNLEALGCVKNTNTISVCGNYLMYVSDEGVCMLRDGYPKVVSKKIGKLSPVCAASYNGKYYLICNKDDGRVIYIYDPEHDIWSMENCADDADNIYSDTKSLVYTEGGAIIYLSDDEGDDFEEEVEWNFRLRFDRNAFTKNTSVRAVARIDLGEDGEFEVKAVYDDGTEGNVCRASYDSYPKGRVTLRLPIKRDLGFYLDFSGRGSFEMRSIKFNYYKSFEE